MMIPINVKPNENTFIKLSAILKYVFVSDSQARTRLKASVCIYSYRSIKVQSS